MTEKTNRARLASKIRSESRKFATAMRRYPRSVADSDDVEKRAVLIALPVLVVALLVAGSVGAGFAVERERNAQAASLSATSSTSPAAPGDFELEPAAGPEVFHSLDRY